MKPASLERRSRNDGELTTKSSSAIASGTHYALVLVRDDLCDLLGWMGAALQTRLARNPSGHYAIHLHSGGFTGRTGSAHCTPGQAQRSARGIAYGVLNGVLSGAGGLALFAAYHTNGNTTLITATSALYPMITVVLAVVILHEKFRPIQALGLVFAAIAILIFSL